MSDPQPNPPRFDPWAPNRGGALRWFAFSSAAHLLLLFLFASVTLTVIQKVQEVKVRVDDMTNADAPELPADGQPSLQELAGALKPVRAMPQKASAPSGPVIQGVRAADLPRLGGIGPKIGASPSTDDLTALTYGGGGQGGAGAIGGLGGGFGDYVGGLRKVGLDVALVIDTTDSMQFVIDEVKQKFKSLVGAIHRMVPTARIGIVAYRDQGDDYVVRWSDLSFNTAKLQEFITHLSSGGGGDFEEAVKEALEAAVDELKWRKQSRRIIILVGSSPPHEWDVDDVQSLVRKWRKGGGYLSTIDVTARQHDIFDRLLWKSLHGKEPYQASPLPEFYKEVSKSFGDMAKDGGGEFIRLDQDKVLIRSVIELTFGQRWKVEMAKFLKELS